MKVVLDELNRTNLVSINRVDLPMIGEMALVFAEELSRFPCEWIAEAFAIHRRENKFLPALSEIYAHCRRREAVEARKRLGHLKPEEVVPISVEHMREIRSRCRNLAKSVPAARREVDVAARREVLKAQLADIMREGGDL